MVSQLSKHLAIHSSNSISLAIILSIPGRITLITTSLPLAEPSLMTAVCTWATEADASGSSLNVLNTSSTDCSSDDSTIALNVLEENGVTLSCS